MIPPKLALLLCFIFCLIVYIKDSKQDPEISPALWIPVLWMMRCASRSLTYWLYPDGYYGESIGSPHDRIFLTVLMIAGLVVLSRRKVNWKEILANNYWILALYAYMLFSIAWADAIDISFKRWVRIAGDLLMILVVLTEAKPLTAISKLFRRCFILLIPLSIVLSKYFPYIGRGHAKHWGPDMWIGVATHKNTLGQLAVLAAMYFLWNIFQNRGKKNISLDLLYLLMSVYLLNGGGFSRSTTCILVLIIAIAFYLLMERLKLKTARIWSIFLGVFLIVFTLHFGSDVFFGKSIQDIITVALGKDPTLTDRTYLWRDVITLGMQHPIFGFGFGGFWNPATQQYLKEIYSWGPGQAHNGYIEIFLNLGLIGLILFGFTIFSAFSGAIQQYFLNSEYGRIRLVLLLVALIHNYTESSFTRPTHLIWFIFLLAAVNVSNSPTLQSFVSEKT